MTGQERVVEGRATIEPSAEPSGSHPRGQAHSLPVNGGRPVGDQGSTAGHDPVTKAETGRRRPAAAPAPGARRADGAEKSRCRRPLGTPAPVVQVELAQIGRTVSACGPFAPWLASNETRWFSSRVRKPSD